MVSGTTYNFNSDKINSSDVAIKAIERMIQSQGEKFAPNQLEVTSEKVSYSKEVAVGGGMWGGYYSRGSTVSQPNSIYFDLIDEIILKKKKGHWEVRVHSKSSGKWKIFFSWDFNVAEEAAIGFAFLTKQAKSTP